MLATLGMCNCEVSGLVIVQMRNSEIGNVSQVYLQYVINGCHTCRRNATYHPRNIALASESAIREIGGVVLSSSVKQYEHFRE